MPNTIRGPCAGSEPSGNMHTYEGGTWNDIIFNIIQYIMDYNSGDRPKNEI